MSNLVELQDVSFLYAGASERALDSVGLAVREGDFVGIVGPSGAGKSTLASMLSGAIPHHFRGGMFGSVLVDGRDTCEVTLTDVSRVVGSVLQDIDAQMVASVVEDELLFGLENFGVPHDEIPGRMDAALETVGIADLREREIATLSGGQKQKVAIAAILALRPRVLVLDEPTAALDPVSSRAVFEVLRDVNRSQGVTILAIEQKIALLSEFCARVVVMDRGGIVLDGQPAEVFSHGEELRRIGVDSPRTARISNSLAAAGLCAPGRPCLTVEEAKALIASIVGQAGRTAGADAPALGRPDSAAPAAGSAEPAVPTGDSAAPAVDRTPPSAVEPAAVSFSGVSFSYPDGGASVRDLSFEARPGEIVAVIGQNGAGKTTLTKLLNGLLKPASGTVLVAGLDTREASASHIAAHCATLFQNPDRQICKDTVLDEVAFGLELQGIPRADARERARATVGRFGLPPDEAPFALSRGQRQMVALASVVVMEPAVVVLDEPTSGLDYRECMTVMDTVRQMAARGCAVVMVCHDMEVVSDFADRAVAMAAGRIIAEGDVREVFSDSAVMGRASVTPPQVSELSQALAREVSPAFAGIHEVADVVRVCKELMNRG